MVIVIYIEGLDCEWLAEFYQVVWDLDLKDQLTLDTKAAN
jgi:hypothetical protein